MTRMLAWRVGIVGLGSVLLLATITFAQQKAPSVAQRNLSYDVSRESSMEGKVIQYTAASSVAPLGPHVTVQTGSGVIDVHLGSAKLLEANNFSLNAGDTIRVVGENVSLGTGTQFVARVIQKGNQALTVRTVRGFPIKPNAKLGPRAEGGAA